MMEYRQFPDGTQASAFRTASGAGICHVMAAAPLEPFYHPGVSLPVQADDAARAMLGAEAQPVFQRYMVCDQANQALRAPVPCPGSAIGQPLAQPGSMALWAVYMARHNCNDYKHIWHGGLTDPGHDARMSTYWLLAKYDRLLHDHGCSLADDCLRTWLMVRDIDCNYAGMVQGRNDYFDVVGLTPQTHFIASTGINGTQADPQAKVMLDAYAVAGLRPGQATHISVPTHMNPTHEYGVAFERATAVDYGDCRHLWVSGTASIDAKGQVAHPGDIRLQTGRMLQNVEAVLSAADCRWTDLAYAIVYLRNAADYAIAKPIVAGRLGRVPTVYVVAPVCRPQWLIEIECMAITDGGDPRWPIF